MLDSQGHIIFCRKEDIGAIWDMVLRYYLESWKMKVIFKIWTNDSKWLKILQHISTVPRMKLNSLRKGQQIVGIVVIIIKTGANIHWLLCFTSYAKCFTRINSCSVENCPLLQVLLSRFFRCRLKPECSHVICLPGWDYHGYKKRNKKDWLLEKELCVCVFFFLWKRTLC